MQPQRDGTRAQHMSRRGQYRDPTLVDMWRAGEVYDNRPDREMVGCAQVPVQLGGDRAVDHAVDEQQQLVSDHR